MSRYRVALEPVGNRPICVLRAKDPAVAQGLAVLLSRFGNTPDGASMVAAMPAQIGIEKFDVPGLLGTDGPEKAAVVDEHGVFVGELREGDCFVAFDLSIQRAKGLRGVGR